MPGWRKVRWCPHSGKAHSHSEGARSFGAVGSVEEFIRINYDVRAPLCETAFRGSVNGASESARERSSACLITE